MDRIPAPTDQVGVYDMPLSGYMTPLMVLIPDDNRDNLDLNAPYQRGSVWTVEQRRNLILSLLEGIPIAAIVVSDLGATSEVHWRVIDGKQRIETIRGFVAGEFSVPAEWFNSADLNTVHVEDGIAMADWDDLSQRGQRGFRSTTVNILEYDGTWEYPRLPDGKLDKANPIRRGPDELIPVEANIYLRLNRGGVDHTDADLAAAERLAGS